MATSFKRSHAHTATLTAPNSSVAGHHQLTPQLETPGHSRASLGQSLWGHCSFLLERGAWGKVQRKPVAEFWESCCGVTQDRLSSPSPESWQHVRLVTREAHEILPAQGVFTGSGHICSPLLSMLWNSRLPEESWCWAQDRLSIYSRHGKPFLSLGKSFISVQWTTYHSCCQSPAKGRLASRSP